MRCKEITQVIIAQNASLAQANAYKPSRLLVRQEQLLPSQAKRSHKTQVLNYLMLIACTSPTLAETDDHGQLQQGYQASGVGDTATAWSEIGPFQLSTHTSCRYARECAMTLRLSLFITRDSDHHFSSAYARLMYGYLSEANRELPPEIPESVWLLGDRKLGL